MNKASFLYFIKYPIRGLGFNNSSNVYNLVDSDISASWKHRIHNIYLAFLVEGGLVSMIMYLFFTIIPLIKILITNVQIKYTYLISLLSGIAFIQIYLTPTSPEFAPIYSLILGSSMAIYDQEVNK